MDLRALFLPTLDVVGLGIDLAKVPKHIVDFLLAVLPDDFLAMFLVVVHFAESHVFAKGLVTELAVGFDAEFAGGPVFIAMMRLIENSSHLFI